MIGDIQRFTGPSPTAYQALRLLEGSGVIGD